MVEAMGLRLKEEPEPRKGRSQGPIKKRIQFRCRGHSKAIAAATIVANHGQRFCGLTPTAKRDHHFRGSKIKVSSIELPARQPSLRGFDLRSQKLYVVFEVTELGEVNLNPRSSQNG